MCVLSVVVFGSLFGNGVLTMSKYAGRIIAEYISRERWRLREKKYSKDTDFE